MLGAKESYKKTPIQKADSSWVSVLIAEIFKRAKTDYAALKGKEQMLMGSSIVRAEEIENFFNSEWADFLLSRTSLHAEDLLRNIRRCTK